MDFQFWNFSCKTISYHFTSVNFAHSTDRLFVIFWHQLIMIRHTLLEFLDMIFYPLRLILLIVNSVSDLIDFIIVPISSGFGSFIVLSKLSIRCLKFLEARFSLSDDIMVTDNHRAWKQYSGDLSFIFFWICLSCTGTWLTLPYLHNWLIMTTFGGFFHVFLALNHEI